MPATPPGTSVVEHEVRIAASPETVFAYFTDPVKLVRWMGAEATLDPRPGGICRIAFHPSRATVELLARVVDTEVPADPLPPGAMAMVGEFVEVDPPSRIVLTWGWELEELAVPPQSTLVEVSLTRDGDDTVVRLTHRQLPGDRVAFVRGGWEHYLPRLAVAAGGGDPGTDPWEKE